MGVSAVVALSVVLVSGAAAAPSPAATKSSQERIIKTWIDGPVRYLMTTTEYERVRAIQTVPGLARYITDFWAHRDPSPGTFENEYRRLFWNRVIDANRRFQDSTVPGWKTDRGKILILLGEPYEVESDEHPNVIAGLKRQARGPAAPNVGERGIERWHYMRQYSQLAEPEFVVAFIRDESLEWKLSTNPDLLTLNFPGVSTGASSDPAFGGLDARLSRPTSSPTQPSRAEGVPSPLHDFVDTSIFANYDLGLEMSVPPNAELVTATVVAREFLPAFTATPRFEFFRAPDGATFVRIGALVRTEDLIGTAPAGGSDLRIYASLTPANDPARVRYASNEGRPSHHDLSRGTPPGEMVDAWTDLELSPGAYRAVIAVEDSRTGRLGRGSSEVEVPDYGGQALAISSLVLASEIDESQGRLGATARASQVFRRSETFGVYYEVYGSASGRGRPSFDVSYGFFRFMGPGALAAIGEPILLAGREGPAQAWSFPLREWPVGRYRLAVRVGTADGRAARAEADFEIVE